jgi:hypothetical protein
MSKHTDRKHKIPATSSHGGFASRNAEPSIPKLRLLSAGCDTLYWSGKSTLGEAFDALRAQREAANAAGDSLPWATIHGFSLSVLPHGALRYPVVLDCFEFRIHLTNSGHLPTVYVELRSPFIQEVGLERAFAESVEVVAAILPAPFTQPHISRIDLFADYADWAILHADYAGFITQAKRHTHASDAEQYETIQFGKTPFLVRAYRKDIERRDKGYPALPTWNGYKGPVTRIEAQASSEFLRRLGTRSFAEVVAARGDIWRHGTHDFVELRVIGSGKRDRWPLRAEWRTVQETGIEHFPASGLVPFLQVQGDRLRCLWSLYGYLSSLAAIEGVYDIKSTLARFLALLPTIERGRSFTDEARRKRARLPRSVLNGNIDSASGLPAAEGTTDAAPNLSNETSDDA